MQEKHNHLMEDTHVFSYYPQRNEPTANISKIVHLSYANGFPIQLSGGRTILQLD